MPTKPAQIFDNTYFIINVVLFPAVYSTWLTLMFLEHNYIINACSNITAPSSCLPINIDSTQNFMILNNRENINVFEGKTKIL